MAALSWDFPLRNSASDSDQGLRIPPGAAAPGPAPAADLSPGQGHGHESWVVLTRSGDLRFADMEWGAGTRSSRESGRPCPGGSWDPSTSISSSFAVPRSVAAKAPKALG